MGLPAVVKRRVFAWETAGGGEQHFRIDLPWPLLDRTRFDLHRGVPGPDIHDFDTVFVHRLAGPSPLWLDLCADPNVLTIYDMDDDLLCIDPENAFPYSVFHPVEADTRRNVEAADVITVSSPGLFERYKQMNPATVMLPICIPDDMPDWPIPQRGLVVGWGGSMFKAQDWAPDDLASRLAEYAALVPGAEFVTMGGDFTRGLLAGRHRHVPFDTVHGFYRGLDFSVGLAPLMRSPFNAGKCHTKLVEYGARGIPTVASAVGQYTEWIRHGVNGFLVEKPSDWVEYLLALSDPDVRARMSAAAHESARAWTIGKHVHRWEAVFNGEMQ
jgi:glycosyltransferase involved in cell wall biosynthesis